MQLFILILLIVPILGIPPSILSSTYHQKKATILGAEQTYFIFEMEFDQDIYYQENWVCPCTNGNFSVKNNTSSDVGLPVEILEQNVYTYKTTNFTDISHFKFYLQNPNIVRLELQSIYGQMQLYASTGFNTLPDAQKFNWIKYTLQRDAIWICPTDPRFALGWWYLTIQNMPPVFRVNSFRVRWSLIEPTVCEVPPLMITNTSTHTILQDSVGYTGSLKLLVYQYFMFKTKGTVDFAVAARQQFPDQEGDVDLYISFTNPFPSIETSYDYAAFINHDDALSLRAVYPPYGIIYLSVQTWKGDNVEYTITATIKSTFLSLPLVELPPQALYNTLAGSTFVLDCEKETFKCEFPAHIYCMEPQALYQCCSPLTAIPPLESGNPLWPSMRALREMEFTYELPWAIEETAGLPEDKWGNQNKKLSLGVLTNIRYPDSIRYFALTPNIGNCTLRWRNNLANSIGEPISQVVKFTPKTLMCNTSYIPVAKNQVNLILDKMMNTTDYNDLRMYHLQIRFILIQDQLLGCRDKLLTEYQRIDQLTLYKDQTSCFDYRYTNAYNNDPCCTYMGTLHHCCMPQDRNITLYDIPMSLNSDFDVCLNISLSQYLTNLNSQDASLLDWSKVSNFDRIKQLGSFVQRCREQLLGFQDLLGILCSTDQDCLYGKACLPTGRCNHTDEDVITCWVGGTPKSVAQSLFNNWRLYKEATPQALTEEISNRFMQNFCTGPDSIKYRDHWFWATMSSDCQGLCERQNLAPRCFETDAESCPIPPECPSESATECFHWFTFIESDGTGCETEMRCNWNVSLSKSECLDTSGVCLDSSGLYYNFDSVRCNLGVCTENTSISDTQGCQKLGHCSNPEYSTETECLRNKKCTQNVDSGCFAPFEPDFYGTPYCSGLPPTSSFGCPLSLTEQECLNRGYIWADPTECLSQTGCFNSGMGVWTNMSQSECEYCALEYTFTEEKVPGVWIPGVIKPLMWVPSKYSSVRVVKPSLDYLKFDSAIKEAIIAEVALSFVTQAVSETEVYLNTLEALMLGEYSMNRENRILIGRGCPYVGGILTSPKISINIKNNSLNTSQGCVVFQVYETNSNLYKSESSPKISTEIFVPKIKNDYSIVTNQKNAVVGQIITSGYTLKFDSILTGYIEICLTIDSQVGIDDAYSIYVISMIDSNGRIRPVTEALLINNSVCGNISSIGTYMGAKVYSDYKEKDFYNSSDQNLVLIFASIYYAVTGLALFQIIRISSSHYHSFNLYIRYIVLISILVFCYARGVFFSTKSKVLTTNTVAILILFELPTIIINVTHMLILYLMLEKLYSVFKQRGLSSFNFRLIESILYICLIWIVALLIGYTLVQEEPILECKVNTVKPQMENHAYINLFYLITIDGYSILPLVYYVITVSVLFFLLPKPEKRVVVDITEFVVLSLCLIIRNIISIISTNKSVVYPVYLFALLEIIPSVIMIYVCK